VPNIKKWQLQLIGVTAMYIASKMEVTHFEDFLLIYSLKEIIAPKLKDFARSTNDGYRTK